MVCWVDCKPLIIIREPCQISFNSHCWKRLVGVWMCFYSLSRKKDLSMEQRHAHARAWQALLRRTAHAYMTWFRVPFVMSDRCPGCETQAPPVLSTRFGQPPIGTQTRVVSTHSCFVCLFLVFLVPFLFMFPFQFVVMSRSFSLCYSFVFVHVVLLSVRSFSYPFMFLVSLSYPSQFLFIPFLLPFMFFFLKSQQQLRLTFHLGCCIYIYSNPFKWTNTAGHGLPGARSVFGGDELPGSPKSPMLKCQDSGGTVSGLAAQLNGNRKKACIYTVHHESVGGNSCQLAPFPSHRQSTTSLWMTGETSRVPPAEHRKRTVVNGGECSEQAMWFGDVFGQVLRCDVFYPVLFTPTAFLEVPVMVAWPKSVVRVHAPGRVERSSRATPFGRVKVLSPSPLVYSGD